MSLELPEERIVNVKHLINTFCRFESEMNGSWSVEVLNYNDVS